MKDKKSETTTSQTFFKYNSVIEKANWSQKSLTAEAIEVWLSFYLAQLLDIKPDEVDIQTPFERYGLDSAAMAILVGDLERWLKCELSPTLPYDYPTIKALALNLANENGV